MQYLIFLIITPIVLYALFKVYKRGRKKHYDIVNNNTESDKFVIKEAVKTNIAIHFGIAMAVGWGGLGLWVTYQELITPDEVIKQNAANYRARKLEQSAAQSMNEHCEKFARARQECAIAANYSQCIEIKGSSTVYIDICNDNGKVK